MQGRTLFEFYRDGEPDKLRNVQSVEKSALSALVGIALAQGAIASVDQPVVAWWFRLAFPQSTVEAIVVSAVLWSTGFAPPPQAETHDARVQKKPGLFP